MVTDVFVERLQAHLAQLNLHAERGKRVTAYKVALEVGLDPTYVTNIFRGRKNGTPETLKRLSNSRLLKLSYERLRSWQALNALEPEVLRTCIEELDALELAALANSQNALSGIVDETVLTSPSTMSDATVSHTVPLKWVLESQGFVEVDLSAGSNSPQWSLNNMPPDICSELSCIRVEDNQLWPPLPCTSHILVRRIQPTHLLHANRWYVVQLRSVEPGGRLITYDPETRMINSLYPHPVSVELKPDTLNYAFEVIQYQVNMTSPEAFHPLV